MHLARRIVAGAGGLMACALITLISMIETQWVKDHPTKALWIGISLLVGAGACFVFYILTREKQSPNLANSGNYAGRDNTGTQIAGSIIGDAALEKILKASSPVQASSRLYISSAEYFSTVDPTRRVDVTDCLRALVADDKLVLEIQNHNFVANEKNYVQTDPHPYKKKKLRVIYSFNNGPLKQAEQLEETTLRLPEAERSETVIAPDTPPHLELDVKLMWLVYKPEHCAWDEATQFDHSRREALVVWVANPIPPPGKSGVDASRLSAHIRYSVEGKWSNQVSRGYWLHHSANEISIAPGDRAALIIGLVDWSHWVAYVNPYRQPPDDGILGPAFRDHGKEEKMPLADMDIEVSLLAGGSSTLEQHKMRLCFSNGRPAEVRKL